ncbi:MAG: aspartate kinase [Clostridiales bacterium]|jgi:aspartate kinase|nr:aspartate kinase [Clostridiales bacterium]MDN5297780.1 aspartate kinase [Clostridiales bacterium]
MAIIVQKYGGTSMADADCIKNVAQKVLRAKNAGKKVVVVVSAPAGMTDDLIRRAKQVTEKPTGRELDMILSTGEQISISLLAMAIQNMGEEAISFTSAQVGILTDGVHNKAKIEAINTSKILAELERNKVVVIAGFQGVTKDLEITTLGRGGSDTSAVALGVALEAEEVEIYTDVDGIYTADPRIVPNARKIDSISFDEMLEMAGAGAKVLHLRSVELAAKNNLPIHLRSSFTDTMGTYVVGEDTSMEKVFVRGVAHTTNNAKITIANLKHTSKNVAYLFHEIAEQHINVDVITQNYLTKDDVTISFTVTEEDFDRALALTKTLAEAIGAESVTGELGVAKVCVIGVGMKSTPGVAARVFECLANNDIEIDLISTSDINITCVINQSDYSKAVLAIHNEFDL